MEPFCRAIAKFAVITAVILSLLLIGIGILILWNPLLIAKIFLYGIGVGGIAVAVICLVSLLIAVCSA